MVAKNADFIGAILLHQNRRDNALGLTHITTRQKGLLWYYNFLQYHTYDKIVRAAIYNGIIQSGRLEIKNLIQKANDSPEQAGIILKDAQKLRVKIKKAYKELKALNG